MRYRVSKRSTCRPYLVRRGLAMLEVVLTIGIGVPIAAMLFYLGLRACRNLYHAVSTLVGWPYQ